MINFYDILGVRSDATLDEIEEAYRALARKVHPDANVADTSRAEARMKQLNEIRETLTDPLLRAAYDGELRRGPAPRVTPYERVVPSAGYVPLRRSTPLARV